MKNVNVKKVVAVAAAVVAMALTGWLGKDSEMLKAAVCGTESQTSELSAGEGENTLE